MPPKSSKAKARAAARAEKREAKKGANGGDDDEQDNIKLGEDQADTSKGSEDIGDSTDAESEGGFEDAQGGEEDGLQRSRSQQNADAEQEDEEEEEEGAGTSEDKEAASAQGEDVTAEEAGDAGTAASVGEAATDAVDQAQQEHTSDAAAAQTTSSELAEDTTAAEKGNEKPAVETIVTPPEATESAGATPATESTGATPATGTQQRPPPPPPRPNVDTSQTGPAAASSSSDASRARSQSSLWDRLRSPAEKATQSSGAGSLLSPDTDSGSPSVPRQPSATSTADGNTPSSRRPSYMPASSGFFSSLTSAANFAATSAASRGFALPERLGGGSASAAAAGSAERKRLPRHQVDEAKMMEDQMRFAEARHVLATSKDPENIRKLGKDLEEGWREKLREVTELHLSLEDLAASVSDIQDENEHLRAQMAQLSEQIALREEDFEGFQRLTVAHQQREKELWKAEGTEERERLEWKEREAVRILAEERAINAQLRLVLMSTLKDGGASGLISGGSMVARSRDSGNEAEQPSDQTPNSSRRNTMMSGSSGALFDNSYDSEQSSPSQELSRPGAAVGSGGGAAGEEGESIQDDVLFNLNLPHAQNQGGSQGGPSQGARGGGGGSDRIRPTSSLFSDVMPLDQLKLLLRIDDGPADGSDGRGNIDAVLPSIDAQRHNGKANGAIKGNRSGSPSSQAMDRTLSSSAASSTSSSAANYQPSSSTSLESHLVAAKGIADYQLSQTLQLENLSLRSRLKDEQRQKGELESEVKVLKDKVAGMEEALGALLEQTGGS
ncbi:unnamed protein product [Jaminaea pallidilutea]